MLEDSEYASMIGALQFLTLKTRPDIAAAVGIITQQVSKPTPFLLKAAKRVFAYLKKTSRFGLVHQSEIMAGTKNHLHVEFFCDSDHAGDTESRISRTGYIGYLNGCPFLWRSSEQKSITKSTAEPEYIATSKCAQDISRISLFLAELEFLMNNPIRLYSDNVAAQNWTTSEAIMRRAKNIELRYHYVREKIQDSSVKMMDIESAKNPADGFTKPLDKIKFQEFRDRVGVFYHQADKHQEEW